MFFERPDTGEVAVLVHVAIDANDNQEDPDEFVELVISAGAEPAAYIHCTRKQPTPGYYVGSGKLDEIADAVRACKAEVVLFNTTLSPSQERNLEQELKCRVLDRTGLILDIFAQRARSYEGKLQVELAQLQHVSTRLKRGWTHLDRQKGGIGLKGAGETQLELDQRMIGQRIKAINKSLSKVRAQREQGRRSRKRAEIPTVSLVGYTNAGKSSLFNALTNADIYAADQLFATLDSTLRRIPLANFGPVIVADTVGFISHLPHKLVEAFRATLEETTQANLLLHVVDCANENHPEFISEVEDVLHEIDAGDIPTLQVFNKIDLLLEDSSESVATNEQGADVSINSSPKLSASRARIQRNEKGQPVRVWVSAQTGSGLELLQQAVTELLAGEIVSETLIVPPMRGKLRSQLYERGVVEVESVDDLGNYEIGVRLPKADLKRILTHEEQQEGPAVRLRPV